MTIPGLISIVVPFYNEEGNIEELHRRLVQTLNIAHHQWELIFVDDGSRDRTFSIMKKLKPVIALRLKKNFGQTQAFAAGIQRAKGDIIITMDGDLENDPADIPILLAKLKEGYDIVSGWRKGRWKEKQFTRRLPSTIANHLISWISGVSLHDHGCMLKVYRRAVLDSINLTGEMHRMIAAYAARGGARVLEVPIRFEPRRFGKSNYGLSRTFKVILDIFAFHFFQKYAKRPIHFFGGIGFISLLFGSGAFLWMLLLKYIKHTSFIQTPLPMLSTLFFIVGFQFILMGLLAEILVRTSPAREKEMVEEIIINR